jgi:hypothetical protein
MVPHHLRSKLENMPPNKGYVYKGSWYFGTMGINRLNPLDFEKAEYCLFELVEKNIMHIHKYNPAFSEVIEKNLSTRKERVLSRQPRNNFYKKSICKFKP